MANYSDKELKLIHELGFGYLLDSVEPIVLYRMMRDRCFMQDITGPIAESVRRCCEAMDDGGTNRLTPEWDALINDNLDRGRPLIYIASPYTAGDPCVNTWFQVQVADALWDTGQVIPFVPLLSHFHHSVAPRPYEDWITLDLEIVKRCRFDALLRLTAKTSRLTMPTGEDYSVEKSSGADGEVHLFKMLGRPCFFSVWNMWKELRLVADPHAIRTLERIQNPLRHPSVTLGR